MATDEQIIRDVQATWFEATGRGDLPRLMSLMAEDVVFLAPGQPPFGRDAFATEFSAGLQQHKISCGGELEEVIVVGDAAYTRGRLAVSVTPISGGAVMRLAGYTLSVFRRQPNGHWVLARDANLLSPLPDSVGVPA